MNITGLIIDFLLLGLSLATLHYISKNYFIKSLDHLSKKLKMSSDMAGSTLMAAGSSAPELAVALFAVFMAGSHEAIGIGTIVGSALFNILLITGVVMYIHKSAKLIWQPILRDIIFYILAILLLVYVFIEGEITLLNAALLVGVYLIYILVVYFWKRIFPYEDIEVEIKSKVEDKSASVNWINQKIESFNHYFCQYQFFVFIISIGLISILSWILVRSAVGISESLGIPELLIGLTIVAIGTSIPDLISSMIVARQGRPGMAINNAIGSNVFDILIGLGLPFLLYVLINGTGFGIASDNLIFSVSILMASAVILLLFFLLGGWKSSRMVGVILILLYVVYLGYVIYNSI